MNKHGRTRALSGRYPALVHVVQCPERGRIPACGRIVEWRIGRGGRCGVESDQQSGPLRNEKYRPPFVAPECPETASSRMGNKPSVMVESKLFRTLQS
jgi:hypothetical protein